MLGRAAQSRGPLLAPFHLTQTCANASSRVRPVLAGPGLTGLFLPLVPDPKSERPLLTRSYSIDDLPVFLRQAVEVAVDKNARAPVVLNVTDITGYTDWVLILSGRSDRHVAAIAEGINEELRAQGRKPLGSDGFGEHSWDLIDYDDFIVHVFYHPVRMHFDLESMWSDAARVPLGLPADVMDTSDLDELTTPDKLPEFRGDRVFGGFEDEFGDDEDEDEDFEDEDFDDEDFDDADDIDDDHGPDGAPERSN